MKKQSIRVRDISFGLGIGLGIGVLAVGGILLLARPWRLAVSPPQLSSPTVTTVPSAVAISAVTPAATTSVLSVTSEPSPSPTTAIEPPEVVTYTVQEDDNLYTIALNHNVTVEVIKAASGLISDDIHPGNILTIPLHIATILPTPTAFLDDKLFIYVAISGDTLSKIAEQYDVTVEAIMSANGLPSDAIQAGQELVIPLDEAPGEQPTLAPGNQAWQPSILEGDLEVAYPLTVETGRFTLHYPPKSLPAQDHDAIVKMVETGLTHIESTLRVNLDGRFDVYVAGSLFGPPNQALRGRSFSSRRRFFFLYDGTGTQADRLYILTHELTHLTTWNTMGTPTSVMLHEGAAVYTGMELVGDNGYIPIEMFCAAYHQTGRLPDVSTSLSFQGHIRDLGNYYAAGCFVQYLIEQYGTEQFAEVYHTGNYSNVYDGQSLADLEAGWITSIESSYYSLPFDTDELVYYIAEVAGVYDRLFASFTGTAEQMSAYQELDQARMALLQGRLDAINTHLDACNELLARE